VCVCVCVSVRACGCVFMAAKDMCSMMRLERWGVS
jgi:hypothetical protein